MPSPALMLLYNNVAELRQNSGAKTTVRLIRGPAFAHGLSRKPVATPIKSGQAIRDHALIAAPENLDVEIADFLSQRIAIDPQQVGGANLVAAGGGQSRCQQGIFDLAQHPMI